MWVVVDSPTKEATELPQIVLRQCFWWDQNKEDQLPSNMTSQHRLKAL